MAWNIFKRNASKVNIGEPNKPDDPTTAIFGEFMTDYRSTGLSAFYAAMNLISNSLAMLPINIKLNRAPVPNHRLHNLIYHSRLNKFTFMKQMVWDMLLHGESVAYIKRDIQNNPTEIIYLEHGAFTHHYTQDKQDEYYLIPTIASGRIAPEDVIHFMMNSNNGYEGKSISFYAFNLLKLAKATDKAAQKYYSSGCNVNGVVTVKGGRKGSVEKIRQMFQQTHSGDNGSGLVILDDDLDYKALSADADRTQMLSTRQFNITEIARYFNINPVLLGDLSKSSYNTIEAANLEFVTHTLMPYIVMIENEFNRKLVSEDEHGLTLDLDEKVLTRGDMTTLANYIRNLVSIGVLSVNEGREMLGLEAIEGGDEHLAMFTNTEQNNIDNNKNTEKEDGEDN